MTRRVIFTGLLLATLAVAWNFRERPSTAEKAAAPAGAARPGAAAGRAAPSARPPAADPSASGARPSSPPGSGAAADALRERVAAGATLAELRARLESLAAADPEAVAAVGEIGQQAGYPDLKGLLQAAVEALIGAGHEDVALEAVDAWATGPLHASLTNAAFEEVSARLAQDSLSDALDWLAALPASEGRNYAIGTIAATWTAKDPKAAMNWAMSLAAPDGRADAMERVFNRWSNQDAVVAAQWLGAHAADPAADQLITELVGDSPLVEADPRLAATWSESISDPALRQRYLTSILLSWGRRDPAAAAKYLEADTYLSDEQKEPFLQALRPK